MTASMSTLSGHLNVPTVPTMKLGDRPSPEPDGATSTPHGSEL
jgi:hypothetical protein